MKNINSILKFFVVTLFFIAQSVYTQSDSIQIKPDLHKEMITVPLYENTYPDYKQSQAIRYAVKWCSFGLIPGFFWGKYEVIGTPAILATVVAVPVLGAIGGYFGRKYGIKLNETKSADPRFVSKLYTFGHELSYDKLYVSEDKNYEVDISPKYSLVAQRRTNSYFIPEEFRLGYSWKDWYNPVNDYDLWENRYNFDVLFNSGGKIFQVHYGIGGGYSWGELETEESTGAVKTENIHGLIFYPIAGVSANVNDFFYLRIEGKYELSYFNSEISDYFDNPETGYFVLSFSFGTYLF
jgi:hypothetical protein